MAESGLNIREEPRQDSKILDKLPFGTIVYVEKLRLKEYRAETIDGVIGYWVDVEIPEKGKKGYAFSPYLHFGKLVRNTIGAKTVRIESEGFSCNQLNFHPQLDWYGLYKEGNSFYFEKVEVELLLSKVNYENGFQDYIGQGDEGVILKTDQENQSLFLIGTKRKLSLGTVPSFFHEKETGYAVSEENGFLFPEEKMRFNYEGTNYVFRAFEQANVDSNTFEIERKYELELTLFGNDRYDEEVLNKRFRDELSLCCNAMKHTKYQTPRLNWVGDINMDKVLDFIIYQHTMTEGDGACWINSLYLSEVEGGRIKAIKLEDSVTNCSCM